jgi:hypothetical protein
MPENQKGRENQGGNNRGNQGGGGKSERGLASADKETRERVAREGGKASSGGGRSSEGGNSGKGR